MPQTRDPDKSYVGMARCFFCLKEDKILLDRRLRDVFPRDCGVIDLDPCNECKGLMEQGILLISVRVGEFDALAKDQESYKAERAKVGYPSSPRYKHFRPFIPNPFRTGGWCVVKEDYIKRVVQPPELLALMLRERWSFIEDDAWNLMGLPRGDYPAKEGGD